MQIMLIIYQIGGFISKGSLNFLVCAETGIKIQIN